MALLSGKYVTKVERQVIVWPKADANGDAEPVWENEVDSNGNVIGRFAVKDKHGTEVRSYYPPEGFANRPSYDHSDNYVMVDARGVVVRQPNGEAINIKPGQALAINPDGSVEVLSDEYAQYVFSQLNDVVDEASA